MRVATNKLIALNYFFLRKQNKFGRKHFFKNEYFWK